MPTSLASGGVRSVLSHGARPGVILCAGIHTEFACIRTRRMVD